MDIRSLADSVTLVDVRTVQTVANLKTDGLSDGIRGLGELVPHATMDLSVNPVSWGRELETWFRVSVESDQFELIATVAVLHQRESDEPIDPLLQAEFIERVSIMTAYPYLRALVQQLGADLRLGDLTLGILRPGEFRIPLP